MTIKYYSNKEILKKSEKSLSWLEIKKKREETDVNDKKLIGQKRQQQQQHKV